MANRRFFTKFQLKWDEYDPECELDEKIDALLRNPRRMGRIKRLVLGCEWRWDSVRLEQFKLILDAITRLEDLVLAQPPVGAAVANTIGGEFSPVLRLLVERGAKLKIIQFEYNVYVSSGSPVLDFLAEQPHIKELVGFHVRPTRSFTIPQQLLPALKKLETRCALSAKQWSQNRALESFILRPPIATSRTPSYRRPSRWVSSSVVQKILQELPDTLESLDLPDCDHNAHLGSGGDTALSCIVARFPQLQTLRIPHFTIEPESPRTAVMSAQLRTLPCLQSLSIGSCGTSHWQAETETLEPCLWIQELPPRISRIEIMDQDEFWGRSEQDDG